MFGNRWLPLAFTTGAALALWALAAASGYAWQLFWPGGGGRRRLATPAHTHARA